VSTHASCFSGIYSTWANSTKYIYFLGGESKVFRVATNRIIANVIYLSVVLSAHRDFFVKPDIHHSMNELLFVFVSEITISLIRFCSFPRPTFIKIYFGGDALE